MIFNDECDANDLNEGHFGTNRFLTCYFLYMLSIVTFALGRTVEHNTYVTDDRRQRRVRRQTNATL